MNQLLQLFFDQPSDVFQAAAHTHTQCIFCSYIFPWSWVLVVVVRSENVFLVAFSFIIFSVFMRLLVLIAHCLSSPRKIIIFGYILSFCPHIDLRLRIHVFQCLLQFGQNCFLGDHPWVLILTFERCERRSQAITPPDRTPSRWSGRRPTVWYSAECCKSPTLF